MRFVVSGVCTALAVALLIGHGAFEAGEKQKPKYTIKEIMKQAHQSKETTLLKKVAEGEASDEEKTKLVALYVALAQNEPPKGDLKQWKTRTGNLVELATKAARGDEAATMALEKAAACAVCHKVHKRPKAE